MAFQVFFIFSQEDFLEFLPELCCLTLFLFFLASRATLSIHVGLFIRSALRVLRAHNTPVKLYLNMVPRLEPRNTLASFSSSQVDSWSFHAKGHFGEINGQFLDYLFLVVTEIPILFLSFPLDSGRFYTSLVGDGVLSQICFSFRVDEDTLPLAFIIDVLRFTILASLYFVCVWADSKYMLLPAPVPS